MQVRPQKDYLVDRPDVEEQQCLELTGTNRSRALPLFNSCVLYFTRRFSGNYSLSFFPFEYSFPFPGDYSRKATPVPIPNTEVKLPYADGTWGLPPWKSRSSPGLFFTLHVGFAECA